MTPQERAERARPGAYKTLLPASDVGKFRGHNFTFLFAQPRSGSTLLMRLMRLASITSVNGDRPLEFYKSVLGVYQNTFTNAIYGNFDELEKNNVFMDTYCARSEDWDEAGMKYSLRTLLSRNGATTGFSKTTIIGFGNQITEEFVDMLRWMFETSNSSLTIGWLTRNHDDIVKSFQTRDGPGKETAIMHPDKVQEMLEDQYQQFRNCYELEDVLIKYEDLIQDPIKFMMKLNCSFVPYPDVVNQVMNRVIR